MLRKSSLAALAAATIIGGSLAVTPRNAQAAGTSNEVFVGGTVILRVRTPAGGFSPAQRAAAIQERVNQLLSSGPISASNVTVQPFQNESVVRVKDQLLFTADWETARYNQSTPDDLAQTWAARMRHVLPSLTQPK